MSDAEPVKALQFVVKISKYCNLRCGYCYEYNELNDRRRMSLASLRHMFEAAARHAEAYGLDSVSFVWHGGEPLMVPLQFYEAIYDLQREIFGDRVAFWNSLQTNLTVMTDRHLACLKEARLFRGLGVSFDVLGDLRVDTRGQTRTDTILMNIQRLLDAGIRFGAIAVLARGTLPYLRDIYRFYDQLGIESRFLPYYMSADAAQIGGHALDHGEITAALKQLFDAWMTSEVATPVDPIGEYVDYALAHLSSGPRRVYDKAQDEFVLLVNVDGGVWGVAEAYDERYRYGNIFVHEIQEIMNSQSRQRALGDSEARMQRHCKICPYFGHCPGYFAGDATPEQQRLLAGAGCPVREVLDHVVNRLTASGVPEAVAALGRHAVANPALTVAA